MVTFVEMVKSKGTAKGTGDPLNYRSVPSSFEKELVPVQFLKKEITSRNERSFNRLRIRKRKEISLLSLSRLKRFGTISAAR